MSPNGKIPQSDLDLVTCDYRECRTRGEYTNCYLNLEGRCGTYKVHKLEALRKGKPEDR